MNKPKISFWVVLGGLTIAVVSANIYFSLHPPERPEEEDGVRPEFAIPAFHAVDQDGEPFASGELEGRVWVADFIFTRCPGPCLRMTQAMGELQKMLEQHPDIRLVSFTVDPEHDHPDVLKAYGEKYGADFSRWMFLTGDRKELHDLAIDGFKLAVVEADEAQLPETGPYVHSTRFAVVDRRGVARGYFDGLEPENLSRVADLAIELGREKKEKKD